MKCNNCYYAKTNNCSTKGISFFGNDCEEFVNIYIADALINQGRADERERIVRKLIKFAENPCEGDYCKHQNDENIGCEQCVALRAIEIARGGENE